MKNKKHAVLFFLKLTVSFLILYLLISRIGIEPIFYAARRLNIWMFLVILLMHFIIISISALRLKQLIEVPVQMKRLFSISAITYFFNTFTPANLGGEFVKIYLLKKEFQNTAGSNNQIAYAVAPVFIEKFIGLFVTFLLCILFLPFLFHYVYEVHSLWLFPFIILNLFLIAWIFYQFQIGRKIKIISSFYNSLKDFKSREKSIFFALIYTFIIQIMNIVIICILSYSLGLKVDNLFYFSVMPLITLINLIPISIGGLGIREGAFVYFLKAINISPDIAITISLLSYLATVTASIIGLIEYLRNRYVIIDENS